MTKLKERQVLNGCRFRYGKKQPNGFRAKIWSITHTVDGTRVEEGMGSITQKLALEIAAELKANKALNKKSAGKGVKRLPDTYADMQKMLETEKQEEAAALEAKEKANEPFRDFFERFVSDRESAGRPHGEIVKYRSRYAKWVNPVFGNKPPQKILLFDLQRMVKRMKGKAAPSTIVKVVGNVSLAFKHNAKHHGYVCGNPVVRKDVFEHHLDIIKHENHRERYLTPDEAKDLLAALPEQVAAMAQLSLLCGFRAGELFTLKWNDVNFTTGYISIRDTKAHNQRKVKMGREVIASLQPMKAKNGKLVFPNPRGAEYKEIPKTFKKTVDSMGLNDGIEDRRQRIVFHSLRHTCGSWLVDAGIDLFTVQKVLGHKSIKTTEKYVHSEGQLQAAALALDGIMNKDAATVQAVNN